MEHQRLARTSWPLTTTIKINRIAITATAILYALSLHSGVYAEGYSKPVTCNPQHNRTQHLELYKYFVFSEIPKHADEDFLAREVCQISDNETIKFSPSDIHVKTTSEIYDDEVRKDVISQLRHDDVYIYSEQTSTDHSKQSGRKFIGCGKPLLGEIFATIRRIDRIFSIEAIVSLGDDINAAIKNQPKDVKVVRLTNEANGQTILAIRGTDLSRMPNVRAVLSDSSCTFDVLDKIVEQLMSEVEASDRRPIAVIGHSLGGVVAQHVVTTFFGEPRLVAFAFGNIGRDSYIDNLYALHNFHIQGDDLVQLFAMTGRTISGRIIQYVPPKSPFSYLKDSVPTYTHALNSIQKAICACANGKGSVMIRKP